MNLTRKYKIHRLSPCLNDVEMEIITFIENKLKDLKPVKKDDYPKSIFYMNSDGEYILEQDDINDKLWVRRKYFWGVLQEKYLLKYTEIQDIIHYMVLIHLKFRTSTPLMKNKNLGLQVLIHLKFRTSTPSGRPCRFNSMVLIHLKFRTSTPKHLSSLQQ